MVEHNSMTHCQRCGNELDGKGLCPDLTCPFSDHYQTCPVGWVGHPDFDKIPDSDDPMDYCICDGGIFGGINAKEAHAEADKLYEQLMKDERNE